MTLNPIRIFAALTAVGLLLGACTPTRVSTPIDDAEDFLSAPDPEKQATVQPPAEVESALLPPIQLTPTVEPEAGAERFDINVTQVAAREFFMGLVEGTAYNMVVHPGVEGTITLNLKRVTIPDVMEVAASVYGYEFERTTYG